MGNQVIIAVRRSAALDEVIRANPGMAALAFDIEDAKGIRDFAAKVTARFPAPNMLATMPKSCAEDLKAVPDCQWLFNDHFACGERSAEIARFS